MASIPAKQSVANPWIRTGLEKYLDTFVGLQLICACGVINFFA
jgi:hypothetical protein